MLRTVNDQPTLWDAILPAELLVLPTELARVDVLLDDAVFFAPFAAYFDARSPVDPDGDLSAVDVFEVPLTAQCSSKPTTNGKSPTSATSPKPPWPCSIPATSPSRTLRPKPHSRHSETPQSLRRTPARRTRPVGVSSWSDCALRPYQAKLEACVLRASATWSIGLLRDLPTTATGQSHAKRAH